MPHLTYLIFELAWAVPVLAVQWIAGHDRLWPRRRALALSILLCTLYLCLIDSVAIANRVWTIHHARIVGWMLGDLPAEEALFFLLSSAMVVQTVVLLAPQQPAKHGS
jgi:lycopene cyclase domain-containing protein